MGIARVGMSRHVTFAGRFRGMKLIVSSRMRWVLSSLAISFIALSAAKAEDWPCFRGPGRQGISQEKGVPTQWSATTNIRWKTPIPGEGWSSPIVSGDRVFVTTALDEGTSLHLICLDRTSGKVAWDKEIVKQKAGHKSQQNSYATSTPATDGKRVYVVACDGRILGVSHGRGCGMDQFRFRLLQRARAGHLARPLRGPGHCVLRLEQSRDPTRKSAGR